MLNSDKGIQLRKKRGENRVPCSWFRQYFSHKFLNAASNVALLKARLAHESRRSAQLPGLITDEGNVVKLGRREPIYSLL